jgi:hypothetical protein
MMALKEAQSATVMMIIVNMVLLGGEADIVIQHIF